MQPHNQKSDAPPNGGARDGRAACSDVALTKPDITVTLLCNNDCIFCPRSTLEHVSIRRPEELEARLRTIRAVSKRVILSGGEVTVLPEAISLVER